MKKITFLFLVFLSISIFAIKVNINDAKNIGKNYINSIDEKFNNTVIEEITINYQGYEVMYAFNFQNGGYILISADNEAYPILSHSLNGKYTKNDIKMPAAYSRWLQWYKDQLVIAITTDVKPSLRTVKAWTKYSQKQVNNNNKSVNAVSPLLEIENINWNQTSPYNNLCPNGDPAGCVATAMSQIMRFHKYPTSGTGSYSYTHSTYGVQSADFANATYTWDGSSTNKAKVSYHAGVSVDMNYAPGGSGAYSGAVDNAFRDYFKYDDATYAYRTYMSDADWKALINGSLDSGWPVYYSGSSEGAGHAFVCDGYNVNDEYHFNWGWGGYMNSYNTLDDIVPGGTGTGGGNGDYSGNNEIVYNIHKPNNVLISNFTASSTAVAEGNTVTFSSTSLDGGSAITSYFWSFPGGTPSTSPDQNPTITYNSEGNYDVTLTVTNATDSDEEEKTGYITVSPIGDAFSLDFEIPSNYSQIFAPWSNVDVDEHATYGSSDCDFSGEESAFSFMAFNPTEAGFSLASTHGGQKCGMAICPQDAIASNNWLISDKVHIGTGSNIKFWVLSPKITNGSTTWGTETFNVMISTTDNSIGSFFAIASDVVAPDSWTEKTYSLSSYNGQDIYVAIQHISVDKFMFWVDDIEITSVTTGVNVVENKNIKLYPNPTNGNITITNTANSNIQISDINGRLLINEVSSSDSFNLDLSKLDRGTYIVRILNNENVTFKKIVVE